jgi:hypothetical protein
LLLTVFSSGSEPFLEIFKTAGGSDHYAIASISKITFIDSMMLVNGTNGNYNLSDINKIIFYDNIVGITQLPENKMPSNPIKISTTRIAGFLQWNIKISHPGILKVAVFNTKGQRITVLIDRFVVKNEIVVSLKSAEYGNKLFPAGIYMLCVEYNSVREYLTFAKL